MKMIATSFIHLALFAVAVLHQHHVSAATTCASCTTCDSETLFSNSITIRPGSSCSSGTNMYVSSIAIDSPREDSFTYRTFESTDSTAYYPECSHDSSQLCYAVNTHECGRSSSLEPVVTIYCGNLLTQCKIRFKVDFQCTSKLASIFSSNSTGAGARPGLIWLLTTAVVVLLGAAMLRSNEMP